MKTRLLLIVSAALLAGCQAQKKEMEISNKPDYAAIASAASHASHQFMVKLSQEQKKDNLIPEELWGEAIEQLDPIRVEFDRVNVAIVLKESQTSEEGYYCIPLISSYLPVDKKNITFTKLADYEDKIMANLSYYKKGKN